MTELTENIGQKRALLVGIDHYYLDDTIGNLQCCVNDVIGLDEILSDISRGNYTTQILHSQTDSVEIQPTRSNIMSMIRLISKNSKSNDSILLYFAGHGFEHNGKIYLLPADSRFNVLSETAIELDWIKETLSRSLAKKKFMIIDACKSEARIGRASAIPMSPGFEEAIFSKAEGFVILSSCKSGEVSYEWPEMNHGVFSYYLLEGLKGAADYDKDNIVTVSEMNRYVFEKISQWCIDNGKQQTPRMEYEVEGEFLLVKVPSEILIEKVAELKSVFEVKVSIGNKVQKVKFLIEDIRFMSWDELRENENYFNLIENLIITGNKEEEIERTKILFQELFSRIMNPYTLRSFMELIGRLTNNREIKKWIVDKPYKKYLIEEFINSPSWEYAGTMARIINNILPALNEKELLKIIKAIKENDQIRYSFKANKYLKQIVEASKYLLPSEEYMELIKGLKGE